MPKEIFDTTSRWVNIYQLNNVINNIYTEIEKIESIGGSFTWGNPVQNKEDLPKDKNIGYVALVISEMKLYVFNGLEYKPIVDIKFATSQDITDMFK